MVKASRPCLGHRQVRFVRFPAKLYRRETQVAPLTVESPLIVIILAFDTSGFSGSVAVFEGQHGLEDPRLLAEMALTTEQRSAQTLAPTIVKALQAAGQSSSNVQLVATTSGPGSFTGLRVGITTAKSFAYAVKAELVAVSTLEAIAQQAPIKHLAEQVAVHAVLDAQRRELFVATFEPPAESADKNSLLSLLRRTADHLQPAEAWLQSLRPGDIVIGSGLKKLLPQVPRAVTIAAESDWQPRAATVGRLAWRDYRAGRRDDLWSLAPVYLRPSYAEEKGRKSEASTDR